MDKQLFYDKYKGLNVSHDDIIEYTETICVFEEFIGMDIKEVDIRNIEEYFDYLVRTNQNIYNNVVHIARYLYYIDKKKEYIFMTRYFNSIGVLENIVKRIESNNFNNKSKLIKELIIPPFGTSVNNLPKYTKDFMDKLNKYLPKSTCNKVLAGNNHSIPEESFAKEKKYYENSDSLETYLKEKHQRKIAELEHHYKENKVWFEQVITEDAIEYVKANQQILSGELIGDKLYVTKIPYEITNFLSENDATMKRYYACHCSFVRENIKMKTEDIPNEWCYCSAGFAKYPYEVILGRELDVKLVKTPLNDDFICQFEIDLQNVEYK